MDGWICPKCKSDSYRKRTLGIRAKEVTILGSEEVTLFACNKCGYIELYSGRR